MSEMEKNFCRAGETDTVQFGCIPEDAVKPVTCVEESNIPGAMFAQTEWILKDMHTQGLIRHDTDELHMFIGGDPADHENLNGTILFRIENDRLELKETCFVFVPKGCAHNIVSVSGLKTPLLHYIIHTDQGSYKAMPAEASEEAGKYQGNVVVKYAPVNGRLPKAPEGFLTRLLWIDNFKLEGAPYTEAVWFHTTNDTGPVTHVHDNLNEIIAFIGSDWEDPEDLNGDISLYIGGETIHTRKSTLVFVPKQVSHGPLLVHELEKDILHFSGGNKGDYLAGRRSVDR